MAFENTAEMMERAYVDIEALEAEMDKLRDDYIGSLGDKYNLIYSFSKEEDAWEEWVERNVAHYRITHEGTITNVRALELKITLLEERIKMLEGWLKNV